MLTFKQFLLESSSIENPKTLLGMPRPLWQFLSHLSSPMAKHHPSHFNLKEENIFEIAVHDIAAPTKKFLPKTQKIIDVGKETRPEGNLHKRIAQGVSSALSAIETESPKERLAAHRKSKQVFTEFARARGFKNSVDLLNENGKTKKSSGEGVHTLGLALAPHTAHGIDDFNTCTKASKECAENCLGLKAGGNRQYPDAALSSKTLKTHFLVHHPEHFTRLLHGEIEKHAKKATEKGFVPGLRMNVTSDVPWENYASKTGETIFHHFDGSNGKPKVEAYDYTKFPQRVLKQHKSSHDFIHKDSKRPHNYHLTLSHTGTGHEESNDKDVVTALEAGHVVAMVHHRGKNIPHPTHVEDVKTGKRYPTVSGDKDDNTFDRHIQAGKIQGKPGHGVVSALALKGVSNDSAGKFANKVDPDGIIRINH